MERKPLVMRSCEVLRISVSHSGSFFPILQNAGPYAPTKDTYYEKEALPKGPLTNVKVRQLAVWLHADIQSVQQLL